MALIQPHPSFHFDQTKHQYWLHDKLLTSVTAKAKEFKKPFEAETTLDRMADKRNLSGIERVTFKEQTSREWKAKAELGRNVGTWSHAHIENHERMGVHPTAYEHSRVQAKYLSYQKFLNSWYAKELRPVGTEERVYSERYQLGGTLDKIYQREGCHFLSIADWKTNEKFTTDDDFCYGEYLKAPFQDQKACDLNFYSIQLSIYALILEEWGLETRENFIVWLSDEPRVFTCKDYRERLRRVL